MIKTTLDNGKVNFYWDNGKYMGYAYMEVDGYYVFMFPDNIQGFNSENVLRAIADKLKELNKDWDDKVNEYFKKT